MGFCTADDVSADSSTMNGAIVDHTMLTALLLVAQHHGVHLSREQLVRTYASGEGEVQRAVLVHAADEKGFEARAVRMSWRQLMRLGRAVPAILCLKDGTALVLTGVSPSVSPPIVYVRDPATPTQVRPVDEIALDEIWAGDIILIKPKNAEEEERGLFGLRWLIGEVLRERRIFRDVGLAALIMSLFALVPPLAYMVVVDRILVHQRMSTLVVLACGVGFVIIFDTAFGWLRRYLVAEGAARIDGRLTAFIYDRLLGLPIEVFESLPTGLINHRMNEIWRIRNFLTGQLFGTALDSLTLIIIIPAMFFMSVSLSLWVLGIACIMFLVVLAYMPIIGRYHGKVVEAETRKNSFMIETIHGMRTVKSLALEASKRRGWDSRGAQAVKANRDLAMIANQPQTILQPLEKLTYSGTLLLGCYIALSTDQAALAGSLVAFTMLASRATQPLVQIATMLQQVQEVRGAIGQVASIVNIPPEELRADHGLRPRFRGHISFEDVSFRYAGAQNKALDRVTVDIPRGSVVGVMGRSGSGKTTLTRLLQGLHQDYDGLIKIDGVDLRQMDISHLRSNLGVVLQDNFLFSGSVRENIGAARADASFEEIIEAARMAGAEEFIERLPRGYDTYLAEGSTNISGGQRQRIAIARALLVDPPILILDEATSALDPDSEAIINSNLSRISEGRTMVVISHRLTSLVDCDMIVVMERGRVYDVGTHEELLQRCDIYRHLWFQQNRHQSSGVPNERALSGPDAPRE
ncbi:ATP-binding cassette subfamily B protein [Nitrospirillum pindoramense]|uniref:ATP-binding cassette subfamily B protein n=1 Tax=Nitrospirillum amazonense TaxID=28077 RepID=A0A560H0E9_9PROT|nr:ATP-binding cassette subfamily B protein [Nitrospirillum amazonense]